MQANARELYERYKREYKRNEEMGIEQEQFMEFYEFQAEYYDRNRID